MPNSWIDHHAVPGFHGLGLDPFLVVPGEEFLCNGLCCGQVRIHSSVKHEITQFGLIEETFRLKFHSRIRISRAPVLGYCLLNSLRRSAVRIDKQVPVKPRFWTWRIT